jgi:hypothetical protein
VDAKSIFVLTQYKFKEERILAMFYTIAVVLVILWLLGLLTSYTMGGLIHVLLVIAIVVVLLRVIRGENVLSGKS